MQMIVFSSPWARASRAFCISSSDNDVSDLRYRASNLVIHILLFFHFEPLLYRFFIIHLFLDEVSHI